MVELGRELLKSSSPSQLDQVVQDSIQLGSEYLQGWKCHNPSGQPVQKGKEKKKKKERKQTNKKTPSVFFCSDGILYVLVSPVIGHKPEQSAPSPSFPPISYLYTLKRSLQAFSSSLNSLSSRSLRSIKKIHQCPNHPGGPELDLLH